VRYLIHLQYNGTNYHGWQFQPNAITVQQEVDRILSLLLKQKIFTLGCGRTDSGVHAEQFFAHFDCEVPIEDLHGLVKKLAAVDLPGIHFRDIFPVSDSFNARFDAISRTYEYRITTERNPFLHKLSLYCHQKLDVEAMQHAAKLLLGRQDFGAFSKSHTQVDNTFCHITEATFIQTPGMITFRISANRFLRNMVRAIVGTLIDVGKGKMSEEQFIDIIQSKNRFRAGVSAGASGLFLVKVEYPNLKEA